MTRLLASVASAAEAEAALRGGAHLIDIKDPTHGALAALDPAVVRRIVETVKQRRPVSATIGDVPMTPAALAAATAAMAATGVDYLKIGIRPACDVAACLDAVAAQAPARRLVAVLFADVDPLPLPLERLTAHRFTGVMWDTASKGRGSLRRHLDTVYLWTLVARAKRLGLMVGLAGSLGPHDVEPLLPLEPDYLGFRTALCEGEDRAGVLQTRAVARLVAMLAAPGPAHALPAPGYRARPADQV